MAGRAAARLAIAAAFAAAIAAPAATLAQSLQRMTVQSFALTADTRRPQVDVPFHLIVTLRVREPVGEIDNLELPILAELELLGDERRVASGPAGTLYRETIAVVAHQAGTIAIAPATLQAIDARDGKAKQWSTNGLTLYVGGISVQARRDREAMMLAAAWGAVHAVLWLAGILCVAVLAVFFVRRRRSVPVPAPIEPIAEVAAPPPPRSVRAQTEDALIVLRTERTRSAAIRVRAAVWHMIGASEGETLADVLRRPESTDPRMRTLLRSLERSAFTYDDDLAAAIEDACDAMEEYLS